MTIYKSLVKSALHTLQTYDLLLYDYAMDETLVKVTIKHQNMLYTGVTVTPKSEGSLQTLNFDSIKEILNKSIGYDVSFRAYGLACVNAIGQFLNAKDGLQTSSGLRGSVFEFVDENSNQKDNIVIIGHLSPVIEKLTKKNKNVKVFCRQKTDIKNKVYNDMFEYEALTQADIVVVTGASLQGSTVDAILRFTQNAKIIILTGFSAGGHLQWYKNLGFTHLASLQIKKESKKLNFENIFENPSYLVKL